MPATAPVLVVSEDFLAPVTPVDQMVNGSFVLHSELALHSLSVSVQRKYVNIDSAEKGHFPENGTLICSNLRSTFAPKQGVFQRNQYSSLTPWASPHSIQAPPLPGDRRQLLRMAEAPRFKAETAHANSAQGRIAIRLCRAVGHMDIAGRFRGGDVHDHHWRTERACCFHSQPDGGDPPV
jgi:hypothetical protein